ncbi:MAG: single-stranded-DNA-specific exonuclease RecJ [Christensenella sp.]
MNNRMIPLQPEHLEPGLVEEITQTFCVPAIVARSLIRRGVTTAWEAGRFLNPTTDDLHDPFLLPDMDRAVSRIRLAIERNESICVYGDYDADGICATAMLVKRLTSLCGRVSFYIPHRHSEGYGMNEQAVRILKKRGVSLIITVDNGVSAYNEIALCNALGIDVIVTDHHSVGKTIPECTAVVAASRKDAMYPNRYLCGAGVVLKLIMALCGGTFDEEELALAAVATIADVVPLTGENRIISAIGLTFITRVPGLAALLSAAGFQQSAPDEQTVSFMLAPRLNAAGRIAFATEGVELLVGTDVERAGVIAGQLNAYNQKRKDAENEILEEAERQMDAAGREGRVLLLSHSNWNPGVIGIVASRLCERLHVPVILFAEQDGILTGSGRSIEGIDLFENLNQLSHLFVRFGGHARAAGVTIKKERFEEFKQLFTAQIETMYKAEDFFPSYFYDEALAFQELMPESIRALKRLAPFGEGNPEPVFRFNGVRFASLRTIGKDDKHFSASAVQGDRVLRAVAFNKSELLEPLATAADWDFLAKPAINEYRGSENVELFWICANASEGKITFFNAFFEQCLYNESCSEDALAAWYRSGRFSEDTGFGDSDMRKYYRVLQRALEKEPRTLDALIRELKTEELLALCVFSQLSFFVFCADSRLIVLNRNIQQRTLDESKLYRIVNKLQEA